MTVMTSTRPKRNKRNKHKKMLILTQNQLRSAVIGGLKDCINMHGDINYHYLESASKRIVGQLKQYMIPFDNGGDLA